MERDRILLLDETAIPLSLSQLKEVAILQGSRFTYFDVIMAISSVAIRSGFQGFAAGYLNRSIRCSSRR